MSDQTEDRAPGSAEDILSNLGVKAGERQTPRAIKAREKRNAEKEAKPHAVPRDAVPKEDPPKRTTPKDRQLRDGIASIYTMAAMGATFAGDPMVGQIISDHADRAADAWLDLAQKDAKVRKLLEKLTTGSAWGDVAMVHISMAIPILATRGLLGGFPMPSAPPAEAPPEDPPVFTPNDGWIHGTPDL